jgi:hypothetical protein
LGAKSGRSVSVLEMGMGRGRAGYPQIVAISTAFAVVEAGRVLVGAKAVGKRMYIIIVASSTMVAD